MLGINLLGGSQNGFGVTANDGTDGDSGPNALQNFPTLTSAVASGSQIQIKGTLTSTSGADFRIEFFASSVPDGSTHGEGQRFLGSINVNTGSGTVSFTTPIFTASVLPGEFITATATRANPGFTQFFETSEFGPNFVATAAHEIRGTVFDDVDGDADVAEPGTGFFGGATVRLFRDDGASVGFIDAGDTLVTNTTTNAAGQYVFTGLFDGTYYVVVDSKTLNPSTAVWAEQTYGVAGAATGGTFTAAPGAVYSGRTPNLSDNASTLTLTAAEHVTKVAVAGSNVFNINSGFSLNVVTNVRGDANDDDPTRPGVQQQGTLRQFIENANAKPSTAVNPDAMRFVPVVGANAGGGTWWQINVSGTPLPTILDPFTIIDGTAFAPAVNGPVVDINTAAVVGTTVGVDAWMLPGVARPELEITDAGGIAVGLNVGASNTTIRDLAIFGFGAGGNHTGDISIQNVVGTLIEGNVIGAHANLSDPGAAARGTHQAITVDGGDNGTIRGNLIGYTGLAGVDLFNAANGWLVEYNEIRGVGWFDPRWDGVNLLGVNGAVIQRNLITNNIGPGIDVANGSSNVTIDNNTISNNAMLGGTERYGIDLQDAFGANVLRKNIITGNAGAGVLLSLASSANITENSIFSNAELGIDLNAGASVGVGDGVTLNDPGDVDGGPNALQNFPVILGAAINGVVSGTLNSTPLTTHQVEFFASAPGDPEGERYLGLAMVSTDTSGNGSFLVTLPGPILLGEAITATATSLASNFTSEFSQAVLASVPGAISGTIYEDVDGDASLGDAIGRTGVTVQLYRDGGDGIADGADDGIPIATTITTAGGSYIFGGLADGDYWVVVDSRTVTRGVADLYGGAAAQDDIWADQTYGVAGAIVNGAPLGAAGAAYGGRHAFASDDPVALASAQHVTGVTVAGSDATDVDSAFSFNVVTNVRGDTADLDLTGDRLQQGSLRQFILNANAIVDQQFTNFAIGPEGSQHTIAITGAALPIITDKATLDAWTQGPSGYTGSPLIELNGAGAGSFQDGFLIAATSNGSMVRGFVINGFDGDGLHVEGSNTTIVGNYIGTDFSGGGTVAGNNGFGVHLYQSDFNRVGGTGIGEGNVISRNRIDGVAVQDGNGNWILSNYIGTDAAGAVALGNQEDGIWLDGATDTTIAGNLISGNWWSGIALSGGGSDNLIQGNFIGTRAGGAGALGNTNDGIRIFDGSNTTIGGTLGGEGNVIAHNFSRGVAIHSGSGHLVSGNSIHSNGGIGIDLGNDGMVTLNDANDIDSGANLGMNTPVLSGPPSYGVTVSAGTVTVTGEARPGARVQLFLAAPDPSGAGEGQTFLFEGVVSGATPGLVDPTARQFSFTFAAGPVVIGSTLTATATDAANNTSEFSFNAVAAAPNSPPMNSVPAVQPVPVSEDTPFAFAGANQIFVNDPDGNLSSVTLSVANGTITASAAGTATVLGSGTAGVTIFGSQVDINGSLASLVYQALPNFNGPDTLTVISSDGGGLFDNDPVAIAVNPVNDAPVLNVASTPVLNPVNEDAGAPLGPVGTPIFGLVDFATPPGQVDNVTDVDAGATLGIVVTAANTANGSWFYSTNNGGTWNPLGLVSGTSARLLAADANTRLYFQPNPNFNGVIASAITFRAWDGTSGTNGGIADPSISGGATAFSSSIDVASLTVTAVNDAPVANNDAYNVNEDWALSVPAGAGVLVNDTDIDGPALTAVLVAGPTNGGITLNANGSFTYTPNPNFHGVDTFTYRAFDGSALSATPGTVTITVDSVNDAPAGTDRTVVTLEDTDYVFTVPDFGYSDANDAPPNNFQFVRIDSLPLAGSLTNGGTPVNLGDLITPGEITAGFLRFTPAPDANGLAYASFTFQVRDDGGTGNGGENLDPTPNTITIDITPTNDPPVADDELGLSTPEDTPLTNIDVLTGDTDLDGDPLSITQINGIAITVGNSVAIASGSVTLNAGGTLTFTPNLNFTGPVSFDYTVADGQGGTDIGTVAISVTPANDPPVADDELGLSTPEDTPLTNIDVLTGDTDLDGDPLSITQINGIAITVGNSVAIASGSVTLNAGGTLDLHPEPQFHRPGELRLHRGRRPRRHRHRHGRDQRHPGQRPAGGRRRAGPVHPRGHAPHQHRRAHRRHRPRRRPVEHHPDQRHRDHGRQLGGDRLRLGHAERRGHPHLHPEPQFHRPGELRLHRGRRPRRHRHRHGRDQRHPGQRPAGGRRRAGPVHPRGHAPHQHRRAHRRHRPRRRPVEHHPDQRHRDHGRQLGGDRLRLGHAERRGHPHLHPEPQFHRPGELRLHRGRRPRRHRHRHGRDQRHPGQRPAGGRRRAGPVHPRGHAPHQHRRAHRRHRPRRRPVEHHPDQRHRDHGRQLGGDRLRLGHAERRGHPHLHPEPQFHRPGELRLHRGRRPRRHRHRHGRDQRHPGQRPAGGRRRAGPVHPRGHAPHHSTCSPATPTSTATR